MCGFSGVPHAARHDAEEEQRRGERPFTFEQFEMRQRQLRPQATQEDLETGYQTYLNLHELQAWDPKSISVRH